MNAKKRDKRVAQRLVQANVPDAIKELIAETRENKYSGVLIIAFENGNLVSVSKKENISAEEILKEYVPKLKKTIVIRTKESQEKEEND